MSKADETAKKLAMVKARLGKTTGASKGSKPLPKVKIKPTGNPFKGEFGISFKKKI